MIDIERHREKARQRAATVRLANKDNPQYIEDERERKRIYAAKKRADPEIRASLNSRRRELAQSQDAKRKNGSRLRDWKSKNSDRVSAYQEQWREENAEHVSNYNKAYMAEYVAKPEVQAKIWERNLWKNYKLTATEFNVMWQSQNGQCCICEVDLVPRGRQNNSVAVDHNHGNGSVRGLLCQACNRAIGLFKDNPKILQSAAEYLDSRGHYGGKLLKGEYHVE